VITALADIICIVSACCFGGITMKEEYQQNKHLTYEERNFIEIGLNKGRNFTEIAKDINKDRRTISREIIQHKFKKTPSNYNCSTNKCKNKMRCMKFDCTEKLSCYEEEICEQLVLPPYVCNSCDKKNKCRKLKYYYYAKFAYDEYTEKLSTSRQGINLTKTEVYELDKLIAPLIINKKQSIAHIYVNHPDELFFSKPTFYTYVNLGVFSFGNLDLRRKVKYKKRKNSEKQRVRRETSIRKNRTYEDFQRHIKKYSDDEIVEMDTVEGTKGGKVFLTLTFRNSKFMLIYLLEHKSMECVEKVFDNIRKVIGIVNYKKLFAIVLTDNGSEFLNPLSIEVNKETGEIISQVFYCDPNASWQKGTAEKNHEYIRYVLPKGASFNNLKQEDVNTLMSNINNTSRDCLNGKTPFEAITLSLDEEFIKLLGTYKINADDVNLSQKLLIQGGK